VPFNTRILGPDHPDTMTSRNNLANGYAAVGRNAEAITLHEQTLADRTRILGPDHPHTLTSRNNLAIGYRAVGRHAEAITLDEQNLADRTRILGPDHPDTLNSREGTALSYHAAGRHTDAIAQWEQTLANRTRILGPDHPGTLQSRNNLAIGYQAVGRNAEAITLHEQNLADRTRILGPTTLTPCKAATTPPRPENSRSKQQATGLPKNSHPGGQTCDQHSLAPTSRIFPDDGPPGRSSRPGARSDVPRSTPPPAARACRPWTRALGHRSRRSTRSAIDPGKPGTNLPRGNGRTSSRALHHCPRGRTVPLDGQVDGVRSGCSPQRTAARTGR
jgi:hypothetical protein